MKRAHKSVMIVKKHMPAIKNNLGLTSFDFVVRGGTAALMWLSLHVERIGNSKKIHEVSIGTKPALKSTDAQGNTKFQMRCLHRS
jgi:hypothetical protein